MASRRARTAVSQTAQPNVSLAEALTKLGMTQEQFQAKQAELQAVLLQTQPFVPQNSSTRHLPTYERFTFAEDERSRSRSSSVSSSCSSRANSPAVPRTPIKADAIPPRPRDQMELILEERNRRKELQRRASTSRPNDEERVFSTPNRGADRSKTPNLPPDTPHHYKYYSERVVGVASSSKHTLDADDAPETPSRGRDRGRFKALPRYPKTPSRKQTIGSSCPATPRSSPPPEVNLVSSPGPMRPGPLENDNLPFALPEGPYSTAKPDLSYAAIIGRAIMASPNHALALQDIYEYITTVFPYYKRGEQTWMNSVRHALSTMAVFRKVQRGRAEGKSLWAVLDCDVPCFEGGGFKKTLCADMNNGMSYRSRKRAVEEAYGSRAKRKKTGNEPDSSIMMPAPILPPFFPHFASANSHTQSYYQAALQQQQVPADTLFPPLPPSSNYHRVVARTASIPILDPPIASASSDISTGELTETDTEDELIPSSPIERPPSSSSLPDLEFNLSSSSSPALSSHASLHGESREPSPTLSSFVAPPTMELPDDDDAMAAWLRSDSPSLDSSLQVDSTSSMLHTEKKQVRMMAPMAPPSSPTPAGKRASTARRSSDTASSSDTQNTVASVFRPTTADEQAAVPHATGALGRGPLLHPTLVVSALHAASNAYDSQHRPSTPERPITPPRLPTSCSDLPSTPRLAQLESELFNFESPVPSNTRVTPKSPSLSVFNSRAPLLHMGSIEEFLAADPPPFPARTPLGLPRTPKKSPIAGGSSSVFSFSAISPFSTPSRRASRPATATSDLDEELARYLHTSPFNFNFSYDGVIAGVSSDTHAGSPGAPSW